MNSSNNQFVDSAALEQLMASISQVLLGKQRQIKLAITCLLAQGHLLIEDLPGMGKTTLAHALADVLGLQYTRVQFTSDLLPADLLGMSVFNAQKTKFDFLPGPVFTQLLLADEINRATARTQSALLEAMEESQVSVDGETRALPEPFFVIATQNPQNHSGTYELPESQLDRFLMRIQLGFPSAEAERILLRSLSQTQKQQRSRHKLATIVNSSQLKSLQESVIKVNVSESLLDYIQRLIAFTRKNDIFSLGLSPRGSIALLSAAKAWALLEGRDFLLPEDIQQVFASVVEHRVKIKEHSGAVKDSISQFILNAVDVVHA